MTNSAERLKALKRRWWKKNKHRMNTEIRAKLINRFNALQARCKRQKVKFNISYKSYCDKIKAGCYYCGASLMKEVGGNVDRMNNDLRDYTSRNLIGCCANCNKIKSDRLNVDEMKIGMTAIVKYRKKLDKKGQR